MLTPVASAVCPAPSVSITYTGPADDRSTTVSIFYSFPGTSGAGDRYLEYFRDGEGFQFVSGLEVSGVINVSPWGLSCNATGQHVLRAMVQSCWLQGGQPVEASVTIPADTTPSVSVAYDGPHDDASGTAHVFYDFPHTRNGSSERLVQVFLDGLEVAQPLYPDERRGVWDVPLGLNCGYAPGSHTLTARVQSCSTVWTAESSTEVVLSRKPTVSVAFPFNDSQAVIAYEFPQTASSGDRTLELRWKETGAVILQSFHPPQRKGTFTVTVPCPTDKAAVVYAVARACSDPEVESAPAMIPPCKNSCAVGGAADPLASSSLAVSVGPTCVCAGDPVDVTNGNMEFYDADPLPGGVLAPLRRTYQSHSGQAGVFGTGWVTIFDDRMVARGGSDGRATVTVVLDDGRVYVFDRVNGAYRQTFPAGDPRGGMLEIVPATGALRHRVGGSNVYRDFRPSDGRLIALGIKGREEITVTYNADGKPSGVQDSLGRWGWTVSVSSAGLVEKVEVTGHPELAWTYGYSGSLLQSVSGPGGAWRAYTYGNSGLETVKDGSDRLIESHEYDSNHRARTSSGPSSEFTNIQYGLGGRVSEEWKTVVTTADGGTTSYYLRYIAGRMRIVEIDGECHCSSEDAVYARNEDGYVVRSQDSSGYITLRTYLDGRVQSVGRYRPVACDPELDTAASPCRLTPDALATVPLVAAPLTF